MYKYFLHASSAYDVQEKAYRSNPTVTPSLILPPNFSTHNVLYTMPVTEGMMRSQVQPQTRDKRELSTRNAPQPQETCWIVFEVR